MAYINYPYQRYPIDFEVGKPYNIQFISVVPPTTTLHIIDGSFPHGMSYDSNTNTLSGIPTDCGRADVIIENRNTNNEVIKTYKYSIGCFYFTISDDKKDTIVLQPYENLSTIYFDIAIPAYSAYGPYFFDVFNEASWEVLENKLPKGVKIILPLAGEQSARLEGYPVEAGEFSLTLKVTDPDSHQYINTFYFSVPEISTTIENNPLLGYPYIEVPGLYGAHLGSLFTHNYTPLDKRNEPYTIDYNITSRSDRLKQPTAVPSVFNPYISKDECIFHCTPIYEHNWYYNILLKDSPVTRRYSELPNNEVVKYIAVGDDYRQLSIVGADEADASYYAMSSLSNKVYLATTYESDEAHVIYRYNTDTNTFYGTTYTTADPIRGISIPSQMSRTGSLGVSVVSGPIPGSGDPPLYTLNTLTESLTEAPHYSPLIFPMSITTQEITDLVTIADNGIYNIVYVLTKGSDFYRLEPDGGITSQVAPASMGENYYCCGTTTWDELNSRFILWVLNKTERKLIKAHGTTGVALVSPISSDSGAFLDSSTKEEMCAGLLGGIEYLAITDITDNKVRLFKTSDDTWSTIINIQNPSGVFIGNDKLYVMDNIQNKITVFSAGSYTTPFDVIKLNNSYLNQPLSDGTNTEEERSVSLYRSLVPGNTKIRMYPSTIQETFRGYTDNGTGNLTSIYGLTQTDIDYATGTFTYWTVPNDTNYSIKLDFTPKITQFKGIYFPFTNKVMWFINNRFMVGSEFVNELKETLMVGKLTLNSGSVHKLYFLRSPEASPGSNIKTYTLTISGNTASTLTNKKRRGTIPTEVTISDITGTSFDITGDFAFDYATSKQYISVEIREDNPTISFWTTSYPGFGGGS